MLKKALYIVLFMSVAAIIYGYFTLDGENIKIAHKCIGIGTGGLFLLWMPMFIYHRYKDRDYRKYMINDAFFEKLKDEAESFIDKKDKK